MNNSLVTRRELLQGAAVAGGMLGLLTANDLFAATRDSAAALQLDNPRA